MDISQRTIEGIRNIKRECSFQKNEMTVACREAKKIAGIASEISLSDIMQCDAADTFVRMKRNLEALDYLLSQAADILNSIHSASSNILYNIDEHGRKEEATRKANALSIKNSERQAVFYQKRKARKANV